MTCSPCGAGWTSAPVTERKTIRQLRQERGWSQMELALQLGLSQGSVSDWERGLSHPRGRTLLRLAHLFGVNAEDITTGPADQPSQERP